MGGKVVGSRGEKTTLDRGTGLLGLNLPFLLYDHGELIEFKEAPGFIAVTRGMSAFSIHFVDCSLKYQAWVRC